MMVAKTLRISLLQHLYHFTEKRVESTRNKLKKLKFSKYIQTNNAKGTVWLTWLRHTTPTYQSFGRVSSEESFTRFTRDGVKVVAERAVATDAADLVLLVLATSTRRA